MKVLIFTTQIHLLGGGERLGVELAIALNRLPGVHADLLCCVPEDIPGNDVARKKLLEDGVPSVRFLGRTPRAGIFQTITALCRLREIVRTEKYDVIETSFLGPSILASLAIKGFMTQHVAGLHQIYSISRGFDPKQQFLRLLWRLDRRTMFYGVSKQVSSAWIRYVGVSLDRVRTIYNSINDVYYQAKPDRNGVVKEFNLDETLPIALFVGRLTLLKGVDILLQATQGFLEEDKMALLIVGFPNGELDPDFCESSGFLDELKQFSERFKYVRWLGKREDVPRLMASCDLLVHPARIEGFGLVVAEALATGLPIVSTKVGGIPEVVEQTDAILVPSNDSVAFRNAILEVLQQSDKMKGNANKRGRARAEAFRTMRRTDDMMTYFHSIIGNKK
jgi:glycosyltransferase involved in cell wall biosynthesis